jgi:vacuolar protein-sorting-associated protein 4
MAKDAAQQAYQLDQAGRTREAVSYYIRAAEMLQKLINFTNEPQRKQIFYERAMEYIYRVKEISGVDVEGGRGAGAPRRKPAESKQEEEQDELSGQIAGVILTERPNISWEDVAGMENAKVALQEAVVLPMARPDLFKGARKPWKGILLFGPPGCGKTYIAKAVASQIKDCTFFSVSAAAIVSKWLGESEKLVKMLYDTAFEKAPSIIFMDEVDSLAGARGEGENEAMRRVKTQLLQAIEGMKDADEGQLIVTMGATNLPWSLDLAMRRRFEKRIYIPLPDETARCEMFQIHTKGYEFPEVDFKELASWTEGYSASDISLICREALMTPIREMNPKELMDGANPRLPNREDFLAAIQTIRPSVSPTELRRYKDWEKEFGSA